MEKPTHSRCTPYRGELVEEEPLLIRIEEHPYAVIMRTPGDEIPHAAGYCLAEGLVDEPGDIGAIDYCDEIEKNIVTVTLAPERRRRVDALLNRKRRVSQTSCGFCGEELLKETRQMLTPITDQTKLAVETVLACTSGTRRPTRSGWTATGW